MDPLPAWGIQCRGLLTDQSAAYRYYRRFRTWTTPDFLERVFKVQPPLRVAPPLVEYYVDVSKPPEAYPDLIEGYGLSGYELNAPDLAGLEQMLQQDPSQVLVVQMPVAPNYMLFFDSPIDYQQYLDTMRTMVESFDTAYVPCPDAGLLTRDMWVDYIHLSPRSAEVYSRWLGQQIGDLVAEGRLISPNATTD